MVNKICYTKQGFICQLEKGITPNSPDDFDPLPTYNVTECPDNTNLNFTLFNNKCYYFSTEDKNWFRAREFCQEEGGELVSIHTARDLDYVSQVVGAQGKRFWIGLNQLATFSNGFVWTDGSPLNLVNWERGEPNDANGGEKCVEILESCKLLSKK